MGDLCDGRGERGRGERREAEGEGETDMGGRLIAACSAMPIAGTVTNAMW